MYCSLCSQWIAANCKCGKPADHFITSDGNIADPQLTCAEHCPVHGGEFRQWEGEPETIKGEQGGLF